MISISLSEIAKICKGKLTGCDVEVKNISIDSRTIKAGDVYLALKGENYDGHDFIAEAEQKGAIAIICSKSINTSLPKLIVPDTLKTLGQIAFAQLQELKKPLIAVTGSCGKTSTKTAIAHLLNEFGNVLSSKGNFNNAIGLPMSILTLNGHEDFLVLEMGMDHFGEIKTLTEIAKPMISIITNVAPVHIDGVGDLDGVAKAKSEIIDGTAKEGIVILNADSPYLNFWREKTGNRRIITFGMQSHSATVRGKVLSEDLLNEESQVEFSVAGNKYECMIPFIGHHNVMNFLAAISVIEALNLDIEKLLSVTGKIPSVERRFNILEGINGAKIIDDSYNANPVATQAAISVLARYPGKKCLVLGDMLGLGELAKTYHLQIGEYAKAQGIDKLYTYGALSHAAQEAFSGTASHYQELNLLANDLKEDLDEQTILLVKGSNGMKLNKLIEKITLE